jgi:hypothetical protein
MGRAVTGLSVGLLIAFCLWMATYRSHGPLQRGRIGWIYGTAVAVQAVHLLEEHLAGFQREFPDFWGYGWSDTLFVRFNLVALGIFVLAGIGLFSRVRLSLLFVWFMALVGGLGNGLLQIGVTIGRGAYFPGSITGVVHLGVGVLLLRELNRTDEASL